MNNHPLLEIPLVTIPLVPHDLQAKIAPRFDMARTTQGPMGFGGNIRVADYESSMHGEIADAFMLQRAEDGGVNQILLSEIKDGQIDSKTLLALLIGLTSDALRSSIFTYLPGDMTHTKNPDTTPEDEDWGIPQYTANDLTFFTDGNILTVFNPEIKTGALDALIDDELAEEMADEVPDLPDFVSMYAKKPESAHETIENHDRIMAHSEMLNRLCTEGLTEFRFTPPDTFVR